MDTETMAIINDAINTGIVMGIRRAEDVLPNLDQMTRKISLDFALVHAREHRPYMSEPGMAADAVLDTAQKFYDYLTKEAGS